MDCSRPSVPVLHYLPEFAQIHIHWVSDVDHLISCQYFLLLSSNHYQHQGFFFFFFQWVDSLHQVANQCIGASASVSLLSMNIKGWFPLGLTGITSLQSEELSRVISRTTVQKHQLLGTQSSLWSNSHIPTWKLGKP